ncbi:MAG TPA: hypothetical protein VGY56_17310 [Verrucomicrobiae bacterium]|nr:hypothetical protein [Verrucomicrobiae bacterium]
MHLRSILLKRLQPLGILFCVTALTALNAHCGDDLIDGTQPVIPHYDEAGWQLPPGVPRYVDTNGIVLYVNHRFTTAAYQKEALKLMIGEANRVAKELALPEKLPITESNLVEYHVSPFGFSYAYKMIGNVSTKDYNYGVAASDKFNSCTIANYDQICLALQGQSTLPIEDLNTNLAYQLATQWLEAVHVDVGRLNKDCKAKITLNDFWNGLPKGDEFTKTNFVPIYDISWLSPRNQREHFGDVAFVELYSPTKKLLQLSIADPTFILRPPLIFTNLASLFPGVAPIHTNHPAKAVWITQPLWK